MGKTTRTNTTTGRRCGPQSTKKGGWKNVMNKTYRVRLSRAKTDPEKSYTASLIRMKANPVPALKEEERKALLAFKLVDEAESYSRKVDIIQKCGAFDRNHVFNGLCEDCFRMVPNTSYCVLCAGMCTEGHMHGVRYTGNLEKDKKADPYFVPVVFTTGEGSRTPRFMLAGLGCKCRYNRLRDGPRQC